MKSFNSYMKPLLQDCERWLFYLMHRNQQIESKKMKKQRNMFQMKEQDKTPEKDLIESSNNSHKDVHQAKEKSGWTKWEFQQRDRKYKKIQIEVTDLKNIITELKKIQ